MPPGPPPTVRFRWICVNQVPLWRCVVSLEKNVEEHLANMSPGGAAMVRSQYAIARCAIEGGQWETAESSLLRCRDALKDEEARVGKHSYGLLRLWAEFPLVQMYQMRGSADGLQKAVETWRVIFDGITLQSFTDSDVDPDVVSFLYTAQYDCGCANEDSVMKAEAMQGYARLRGYPEGDDVAERELCLLLSYDYYCSGSFEDSLKWIQRANQQILPLATYLRWEVYVLMKLQRFEDARDALDTLSSCQVPSEEAEIRAEEVCRWKQDCDMQMLKNARKLSFGLNSNQEQAQSELFETVTPVKEIMDEMLTRDSTSVRSWLCFHEHFKTARSHINSKLPEGPRVAMIEDLYRSQEALPKRDFGMAVFQLNCCRNLLRIMKKCIEDEAYYSILAAVDHILIGFYQFCNDTGVRQIEKALELRKVMLDCMQHVDSSNKSMEQHYMSLVILTEYQGCSSEDVSREQIVQNYASLMGMKKEQAECDMCFWLFYCDRCPRTRLKRLIDEVMPLWKHSGINHSLTYKHLMRDVAMISLSLVGDLIGEDGSNYTEDNTGVVDQLLKQAESNLEDLTRRFEGQISYEAWVHGLLEETYQKRGKCATAAGDHEGAAVYQELEDMERALGSSLYFQSIKPPSIAVSNTSQLIQTEEHMMEQYYWASLPPSHYLVFQRLYETGHDAQDEGDWERAIFNLELCRDLLKQWTSDYNSAWFDTSLLWIDVPLVQLYHMKTKNLKKSLDLRQEMKECISSISGVDEFVRLAVNGNLHAAIYHLGYLNYPSRMGEIMSEITKWVPKSKFDGELEQLAAERATGRPYNEADRLMIQKLKTEKRRSFWEDHMLFMGSKFWEWHTVNTLLYWHVVQGDYETALDIIEVLKQVVEKHFPKYQSLKDANVVYEAQCLMELKMFQDAELVLHKASEGKSIESLPRPIRDTKCMCEFRISGIHTTLFDTSRNVSSNETSQGFPDSKTTPKNPLFYLRLAGIYFQHFKRYKYAVVFHTACINIINEAAKRDPLVYRNSYNRDSNIITEHRGLLGWYDYFNLGISFRKMFETRMRSYRESLWTHPHSNVKLEEPSLLDTEFTSALRSFQQQIQLVVNPEFIARANHEILKLYATMDESYFGYLLLKYGFKNAHAKHFEHGIADMNDVELMEDENHMRKAQCNLTSVEQSVLEEVEAMMLKYGRRTSLQFANSLYGRKGRYTESWINMLEGHKDVYAKLQGHYLNKMFLEALTAPDHNPKNLDEYRWKAFLYAERQRSRVLLYQMGPQKLTSLAARQLWEFDTNDMFAMGTVQAHVADLEEDSVFVEYNHLQDSVWIIYVVQAGMLSHYLLFLRMKSVERAINDVLWRLNGKNPKKGYTDDKMNKDLEDLHDLLIKPIASHLSHMELHHKLILAPSELVTKVPFAALRDRTAADKKRYLLQRHTISLVTSLRAFQRCNERLLALQDLDFHEGPGAIVALGDPTCGKDARNKDILDKLSETKIEVENIAKAFPKVSVVKLLGEDATAEKLLHWVANPTHKPFRQIIVHIGAHGDVDNEDERNNCLFLARTSTTSVSSAAGSSTAGRRTDGVEFQMDDLVGTVNEDLSIKISSDEVEQIVREVKEMKKKKKKKTSKGKEKKETEEKEEGEEESIELVELSAEDAIEWVKNPNNRPVSINMNLFVEYPELKTKPTKPPKDPYRFGPHVCSVLALKDISDSKVPWRAELVVLGACHTSEGKATAEGLVNLARAFIIAGVPCVVASQWAVPDTPTRALMEKFYKALRHGNDVASSLQSAMSDMIDEGYSMCAWAPFVSWGSSPLVLPESLRCEECEHCRPVQKVDAK